jgi:transposase
MKDVSIIGIDLAKSVFQVHGVNAKAQRTLKRKLKRNDVITLFKDLPPCLIGMEACGTAHHWGRELQALGHTVKLLPPQYVKAYVKRGKTDEADAEAICEAVQRPNIIEVPVKTVGQQCALMLHRSRELLVSQRTQAINAMRSHMAELGLIAPVGLQGAASLAAIVKDAEDCKLPPVARLALTALVDTIESVSQQICNLDRAILTAHRADASSRRLASIPGIGPVTASAFMATVGSAGNFKSARGFAAWLGLTPRLHGTGGKTRLGSITKQGDKYLRKLLVVGATAIVKLANRRPADHPWLADLLKRLPPKKVAVALANKNARIIWALLKRGGTFEASHLPAAFAAAK